MPLPEPQTRAEHEAKMLRLWSNGRALLVIDEATGYLS